MRANNIATKAGGIAQPGRRVLCLALLAGALILLKTAPAWAELRIADFRLSLNDYELTVDVVLLGAIPPTLREGLASGIPAQVRFQVELWRYSRFWVDRKLLSKVIDRQIAYDVLTQAYTVVSVGGEKREPYVTKHLRDAQRVVSDLRGLKLTAGETLNPLELYYVRVRADVGASGRGASLGRFFPFMGNGEEQTPWVSSSLLTVARTQ